VLQNQTSEFQAHIKGSVIPPTALFTFVPVQRRRDVGETLSPAQKILTISAEIWVLCIRPVSTLARLCASHPNRDKYLPTLSTNPLLSEGNLRGPGRRSVVEFRPLAVGYCSIRCQHIYLDWGTGIDKRPGFAVKGWVALGLNLDLQGLE
jgi:hypothetical protein